MVREPPDHCPRCGVALTPIDPPARFHYPDCDEPVSHHPIPTARLAVVDDESMLLVKVDAPKLDLWGTPGGLVEVGEDPDVAGARELREEATLVVDPDDLVLFDARTFAKFETMSKTYLCYAVDASSVSGTPGGDHEIVDARFWTPSELRRADDRLLTSWPETYKSLEWWIEEANAALSGDRESKPL
ncbi:NUDIX hydrolase [Halovivax gelatinilyticus]|uniref:NUDIX hydrolase n=1 Tax=Halovivax gelatinilyticus TaxID=2961597 RepID=UPI0020CA3347|nr:NUDIX domain-containing protein [Halovivax gelatinilyticus]